MNSPNATHRTVTNSKNFTCFFYRFVRSWTASISLLSKRSETAKCEGHWAKKRCEVYYHWDQMKMKITLLSQLVLQRSIIMNSPNATHRTVTNSKKNDDETPAIFSALASDKRGVLDPKTNYGLDHDCIYATIGSTSRKSIRLQAWRPNNGCARPQPQECTTSTPHLVSSSWHFWHWGNEMKWDAPRGQAANQPTPNLPECNSP